MATDIQTARSMLCTLPKASLGFFPTHLQKAENLSRALGVNLYIKRDDLTGKNQFGGNKTRKLEYLIGAAKQAGCEYVFTYGATQSNHAMQTAWTAVSCGLKPVLYLVAVVQPDPDDYKANLLLDRILGAEIHIIDPQEGEDFIAAEKRSFRMGKEHLARLEAEGHKCMNIPLGGANAIGSAAYIDGFVELSEQAAAMEMHIDHLYHATGSGGTMAGLVAGKKLLGLDTAIHSVIVMDPGQDYVRSRIDLANEALELIGAAPCVERADFDLRTDQWLPGYECPNDADIEAIRTLASAEGIFMDTVYTGKAFAALLADVRSGKVAPGSNVVFLHTGGTTALFAEKALLGDL